MGPTNPVAASSGHSSVVPSTPSTILTGWGRRDQRADRRLNCLPTRGPLHEGAAAAHGSREVTVRLRASAEETLVSAIDNTAQIATNAPSRRIRPQRPSQRPP